MTLTSKYFDELDTFKLGPATSAISLKADLRFRCNVQRSGTRKRDHGVVKWHAYHENLITELPADVPTFREIKGSDCARGGPSNVA